jgi:hypothetical protein
VLSRMTDVRITLRLGAADAAALDQLAADGNTTPSAVLRSLLRAAAGLPDDPSAARLPNGQRRPRRPRRRPQAV